MGKIFLFWHPQSGTDASFDLSRDRYRKQLVSLGIESHRVNRPHAQRKIHEVPVFEFNRVDEFWLPDKKTLECPPLLERFEDQAGKSLREKQEFLQLPVRENRPIEWESRDDQEGVKGVFLVKRKRGMSVPDFQEYWGRKHPPLVRKTPHLRQYVQNHVFPGRYDSSPPPEFDGVSVLWCADRDELLKCWLSDEVQVEQTKDAEHFLDPPFPAQLMKETHRARF